METLSIKDQKIQRNIEFDARKPFSKIAREVNLSKEVTNYHIKNLESKNLISRHGVIFNLYNMGKDYYNLFLKINQLQKKKSEVILHLKKIKRLTKFDFLEGNFNICLTLYSNLYYDLIKEIYPFINRFGKDIIKKEIYIVTDMFIKKCEFLYNFDKKEESSFKYIKRTNIYKLNDIEKKITKKIMDDPKIKLTELKTKLNVDVKTLRKYLQQLQKKQIIEFYRTYLNPGVLGYQKLLVFLYLYNFSSERRALIEVLLRQNNITSINICFGNADLLLDVYIKNIKEIYEFLSTLMNDFPEIMKDYEIFPINESEYLK